MTDTLTATIAGLAEALKFYANAWTLTTNKRYGGLKWEPNEELLDDFGNRARDALEALTNRGADKEAKPANVADAILRQVRRTLAAEDRHAASSDPLKCRDDADIEYSILTNFSLEQVDAALAVVRRRARTSAVPSKAEPVRVRELRQALLIDLNVTDEELLRIRNDAQRDGDVKIWGKMLGKIVDAVRAARSALEPEAEA